MKKQIYSRASRRFLKALLVCASLGLVACASKKAQFLDVQDLWLTPEGKVWTATTFSDKEALAGEEYDVHIRLVKNEEGRGISGYDGCNVFFGNYTTDKDNIVTFGPIATTRRACKPDAEREAQALALYQMMNGPIEFVHDFDNLTWWREGKQLAAWKKGDDPMKKLTPEEIEAAKVKPSQAEYYKTPPGDTVIAW